MVQMNGVGRMPMAASYTDGFVQPKPAAIGFGSGQSQRPRPTFRNSVLFHPVAFVLSLLATVGAGSMTWSSYWQSPTTKPLPVLTELDSTRSTYGWGNTIRGVGRSTWDFMGRKIGEWRGQTPTAEDRQQAQVARKATDDRRTVEMMFAVAKILEETGKVQFSPMGRELNQFWRTFQSELEGSGVLGAASTVARGTADAAGELGRGNLSEAWRTLRSRTMEQVQEGMREKLTPADLRILASSLDALASDSLTADMAERSFAALMKLAVERQRPAGDLTVAKTLGDQMLRLIRENETQIRGEREWIATKTTLWGGATVVGFFMTLIFAMAMGGRMMGGGFGRGGGDIDFDFD